VGQQ
jgi:hypothetical protein